MAIDRGQFFGKLPACDVCAGGVNTRPATAEESATRRRSGRTSDAPAVPCQQTGKGQKSGGTNLDSRAGKVASSSYLIRNPQVEWRMHNLIESDQKGGSTWLAPQTKDAKDRNGNKKGN